jgi:hypothetical protein
MAVSIASITIGSAVSGYVLVARRADWATMSLAADSLAMQKMEQVRSARWDTLANPVLDEVTTNNFPDVVSNLDLPKSGTNTVHATLHTTITSLTTDPPLRMIKVSCAWSYCGKANYTNTVTTYRSPDQ